MANDRLQELLAFLEADPGDAFTLYSIAYEYAQRGQDAAAQEYYQKLREIHPDYLGTYYHLGKALERLGQPEEAEAVYREGIQRARMKREAHTLSELQNALNAMNDE